MEWISKVTRREFREHLVGWTLRTIGDLFDDEGIVARPVPQDQSQPGQRRSLVEDYYNGVNWADPVDVRKILRVYENILVPLKPWGEGDHERLVGFLRRDGFDWQDGRLLDRRNRPALAEVATASQQVDPSTLHEHLDRIRDSIESDPGLAIGSAKDLVESVARHVLEHYGQQVDPKDPLARTVKRALDCLDLTVEKIPDAAKGAAAIRQVLAGLAQVVGPMAEIRNLYGSGHGRTRTAGVHARHARLVVGAAATLTTFMLETLDERKPKN